MSRHSFERHLSSLALARECTRLGARPRTVEILTGLNPRVIAGLMHADQCRAVRGRPPNTPEWYHTATLIDRTEASIFASGFNRLCELDFDASRALTSAYRHYLAICRSKPQLSFDRAFDLARQLDGLWGATERGLALSRCRTCASRYLTVAGARDSGCHDCPFCKLRARYLRDPRVQAHFPSAPLPDLACLHWNLALRARLHESVP